jgi:mono/diheme cytochrome c family protein
VFLLNRLHSLFIIAAVVGLVGLTTALSSSLARAAPPAQAPTAKPSATRGEALYPQNCAPCHGDTGKGDGPTIVSQGKRATDFTDVAYVRDKSPTALFDVISNGRMDQLMPPWKNQLNPAQMWDLAFYTWALATPPDRLAAGKTIYSANCVACHGEKGLGDGPEAASLATKPPSFADLAFMAAKSQSDLFQAAEQASGHEQWSALSADDKWAALDFVRTFSYEPLAPETFDGVIAGKVMSGTQGADISDFSGLQATLYSFRNNQPEQPITATTDLKGEFVFKDLGTSPTRQYDVSVHYKGIEYFTEKPISFVPGDTSLAVTVPVYETTNDPSGVQLDRVHVIIDFQDQQFMRVTELHIFSNDSDRTFIGDQPLAGSDRLATLHFALPPGATDLSFEDARMDTTTVRSGDLITDTLPVPPGGRQVLLSYLLPYTRPDFKLVKPVVYNAANFNVLAIDLGEKIKATGLTEQDPLSPGSGSRYLNLVGQNLPAGQPVVIDISNIPANLPSAGAGPVAVTSAATPTPGLNPDLIRIAGLGLALLVAIVAVGYPMVRGRVRVETRPAPQPSRRASQGDSLEVQRQQLLESIAELDDAFEAGELKEADYQAQRSAAKAELIRVMRQQRGLE